MRTEVEKLTKYKDRQVVLNYYEDDALAKREGFHFSTIEIVHNQLVFHKSETSQFVINLEGYAGFTVLPDFKDYYSVYNEQDRIEIYFPH